MLRSPPLPTLWLLSDERTGTASLLGGAARLPRGSGIILRHYATPPAERKKLFDRLRRISRRRGLLLLLAGGAADARNWGADGIHAPAHQRASLGALPPGAIRSAAVHNLAELRRAERCGADIVFVSPLFATRSHPGARPLGAMRFAVIAKQAHVPVMALGGVGRHHMQLIRQLGAAGYGAIDSLSG